MTDLDLTGLRRIAEIARHDPYAIVATGDEVLALIDRIEALEAERDGIRRRDEEVGTDEGWWIGGAWGDYGEPVVPLRILSYVIDGALDQKVESIDPGFALTYAEQVARTDRAEARLALMTDGSAVEVAARAAYDQAFLKHAPEDVDRWDDLAADNDPAAESWREVARAAIHAVAADEQEADQ